VIAFFAEFDPVEYNFDDDGASFDVVFIIVLIISIAWFLSTPLVPGVVIIFIIVLSHDDDAADNDDEKRILPNCKRLLVNALDALLRVVQYKSIVVVIAREAYLISLVCLSVVFALLFPKRAALLEETSDPKSFTKTHLARTLCFFSVLEREAFTKRQLCGQRRRRRQQQQRRSVSA